MPATSRASHIAALLPIVLALILTGCSEKDSTYYPLTAGRWWYYAVADTILDEARSSRFLALNMGRAHSSVHDKVFVQMVQAHGADFLRADGAGIARVAHLRQGMRVPREDPEPRIILPGQIVVGTHWQTTTTLGLAESRTFEPRDRLVPRRLALVLNKQIVALDDAVEVAAGRFLACLRIEGIGAIEVPTDRGNSTATVDVHTREWYARGVGLVKLEREEISTSTFIKGGRQAWELVDFGE
jgi:hypothetical protein